MATPTMVIPPLVIDALSKPGKLLTQKPVLSNPLQVRTNDFFGQLSVFG